MTEYRASGIIRISPDMVAVIRSASHGIRNGRGYLIYWESAGGMQIVDSWETYATPAKARAAALEKCPGTQVVEAD